MLFLYFALSTGHQKPSYGRQSPPPCSAVIANARLPRQHGTFRHSFLRADDSSEPFLNTFRDRFCPQSGVVVSVRRVAVCLKGAPGRGGTPLPQRQWDTFGKGLHLNSCGENICEVSQADSFPEKEVRYLQHRLSNCFHCTTLEIQNSKACFHMHSKQSVALYIKLQMFHILPACKRKSNTKKVF